MYFFTLFLSYDSGLEINILLESTYWSFYIKLLFVVIKIFFIDFFASESYCFFPHFIYGKEKNNFFL